VDFEKACVAPAQPETGNQLPPSLQVTMVACAQMLPRLAACSLKIRTFEFVPCQAGCYEQGAGS
jgi:hypothetical protein